MPYAPIALFTYARAEHTRQAVESLLRNKEAAASDLYIFSDGPKDESKAQAVKENREYNDKGNPRHLGARHGLL